MKKCFLILFLLFGFNFLTAYASHVEIDLEKGCFRLVDFKLGGAAFTGDFFYAFCKEGRHPVFIFESDDAKLGGRKIGRVKFKSVRKGDIILIDRFESEKFFGHGNIDLAKERFRFDFQGSWEEDSELKAKIDLEVKLWGSFDDFLVSGNLFISDGVYDGTIFEKLRCSFLGTPPVFNFTDLELTLPGRGIIEVVGEFDLRDPENFFPSAEFISRKMLVGEWQLFADKEDVSLRRRVGDRFDIKVDAETESEPGAELRYNLERSNYLRLRMEKDDTILGIERRREF